MISPRMQPALAGLVLCFVCAGAQADMRIEPARVNLIGNFAQTQVLVTDNIAIPVADLTARVRYASSNPLICTVTPTGRIWAKGDGEATVSVSHAGQTKRIPVRVQGVRPDHPVDFQTDIMPILSKAGCNAGACHASQFGKGGFKLSVFGFAPDQDWVAIVRDSMSRRVNLVEPKESLLLLKPTLGVPHQGGKRFDAGSTEYEILKQWLADGAPSPKSEAPTVTGLAVHPKNRVGAGKFTQQLRVLARYSNGLERDVTAWAKFDSMDDGLLQVDRDGLIRVIGKGQGSAMVRFEGQSEICTVVVPYAADIALSDWKGNNFIDTFAAAKFKEIGIAPSPLCDDATFLRRASCDAIGTLPSVDEAKAFLASSDPAKRTRLVDRLLGLTGDPAQDGHNNDYAAFWALKWADLIRSNSATIGEQGMWALNNWLKESFRANKPMDRFARELITAKGSTFSNGPANYFRVANNALDLTEATSQLFLGVRMQCAKCHHHPFEPISQGDYYSMAAFFARVGSKGSQEFGIYGRETVVVNLSGGEVSHPRTGKIMKPTPLNGSEVTDSADRRLALADWLTAADNRYFARNIVNRYFGYLLGRGLVEPIDDMRGTNPPSNKGLMDALADDFIRNNYNLKQLLRTIMTSRLYQLDSAPTNGNATDSRFYSHYLVKHLAAEPLLDAVDQAAGTRTKFAKVPLGTRAIELPDAKYDNYFLSTFGKPRRESTCECERVSDANLAQALHTLNGDDVAAKIAASDGRVAKLLAAKKAHNDIVEELYLATLSRRPNLDERATWQKMLAQSQSPKVFYEDLLWSLVNSKQFLFVH